MTMGEAFPTTLAAARQGADWAWAALYRDLVGPVTGYLDSRLGHEPEDLAAETFLQVARGIHDFTGDEAAFRSWVFVIAHRRLIDERRRQGRSPATIALESDDGSFAMVDILPGGDVENEAMDILDSQDVMRMLDTLSPEQRDVLVLRMLVGLTLAETAQAMSKRVGAVKSLQRRALQALHQKLFPDA